MPLRGEVFIQAVAVDALQDQGILMKDVMAVGRPVGRSNLRVAREGFVIIVCGCASGDDVFIQPFQFDIEDGGLDGVQAAVTAYHFVIIALVLSVVGDHF